MKTINRIEGGRERVRTPLVRKGFFYKPLHADPQRFRLSIREFDKANNDYLEHRYKNREREEREREKQRMAPEPLFARALRKLFDRKSDVDVREALDDIFLSMHKGADIASALDELHSLEQYEDYWPIASSILADYYVSKGRQAKVIELLEDTDPSVRMLTVESLSAKADAGDNVSFYVPLVYPLMRDLDEAVAEVASEFLIKCALSSNTKVREAFLDLRDDILADMIREIESQ